MGKGQSLPMFGKKDCHTDEKFYRVAELKKIF